jgi:hypothetical protein
VDEPTADKHFSFMLQLVRRTIFVQEEIFYFSTDIEKLDADSDVMHSCLVITSPPETFSPSHMNSTWKTTAVRWSHFNLFQLNFVCLACIKWLLVHDQSFKLTHEAEIRDGASRKMNQQRENLACIAQIVANTERLQEGVLSDSQS